MRGTRSPKALALRGKSAFAVVLAALALTYLLVACVRQLSQNLRITGEELRHLASNFPNEEREGDQCPAPSGDGEQTSVTSTTEGDSSGESSEAGAAQPEQMGAAALPPAGSPVQTRRCLPALTQALVQRTLLLLRRPAEVMAPILPLLRPYQSLSLIRTLCKIAAAELSAFSTVPPSLQPLRQQAAAVYVCLIHEALNTEATELEADLRGWREGMEVMQVMLQRLANTPPESERLSILSYTMIMECQQRVSHWMLSQVLECAHNVAQLAAAGSAVDLEQGVAQQLQVLNALCATRLRQILNGTTTRYWIQRQQKYLRTTIVYSPRDLAEGITQNPGNAVNRLKALVNAVFAAGGQPTMQWAPLPFTAEEQQQLLQEQPDLSQQDQQPDHWPTHPYPANADELFATPFTQASGPQPQMQAPEIPPITPHEHLRPHAAGQTLLPFNQAQQDSEFPVVHPDPQLSGHHVLSQAVQTPQVNLPPIYDLAYPFSPAFAPPFSPAPIPWGLSGGPPAQSHHPGSAGQQQAAQPSSQQTPTRARDTSSSEDEGA
ncbi:hypothetical protein ACSSS7_000350 [Eimeria intestinalis]